MPEVIVVGVTNTDRTRDLSPSRDPNFPTSGGADRFLDFFEKELVPFVESGYRTAPFRIFAGHSAGGLFALHAMRARPGPVPGRDRRQPLARLGRAQGAHAADAVPRRRRREDARALLHARETKGAELRDVLGQVSSALEGAQSKGLRWGSANYPDENHGSVVLQEPLRRAADDLRRLGAARRPGDRADRGNARTR